MFSLLRTLSLRHALRHRVRVALMVFSVALGVAAWTMTGTLDRTLKAAVRSSAVPLAGAADFQISQGDLGIPRSLTGRLARVAGVRAVRPVLIKRVLLTGLGRQQPAVLLGVDLASEGGRAGSLGLTVHGGSPAAFAKALLLRQSPVLVGAALAREMPRESTRIDVLVAGTPRRLTRVGTVDADGPAAALGGHVLLTDCRIAAELAGQPDHVSRIDVLLEPGADRARVRLGLDAALGGAGRVFSPEVQDERVQDALASLRIGFSLCGAMALGLALLLTAGAFGVGVAERRAEIGMLRALGAERGQVWRLFLAEAALLGTLGAALGLPLGVGLAWLSCGPMLRVLSDVFLPLDARVLEVETSTLLGGLVAGIATTVLAALVPAARAAALVPIAAIARGPSNRAGGGVRRSLAAASVLIGLAVACYVLGERIGPRFRIFGPLIPAVLGTMLAIPAVTVVTVRLLRPLAERWLGLPGRIAADHLVRAPGQSGLAIASLAGGMALIVQTGGVIQGNEASIRNWVDSCVAGDLFVTSGGPLSASGQTLAMREDVGSRIETEFPGVRAVPLTFRYLPWRHDGREVRLRLIALDAHRYHDVYRERRPSLADLDLFHRLAEPGTALVSENFAALYGVGVGDTISLPGTRGPVPLRVVGTVVDYSCNRGTVMVDRARFGADLGTVTVDVFSLSLPPGAVAEEIGRRLQQTPWAAEQALCVLSQPELRRHILGMVNRLYGVAYVQEVTAAVVAALGVAMALLISVLKRRRELGLLRAVGATPAQAVSVVFAEALLMAIVGILFGLLIGTALEWYVLRIVLLEESGFVYPVRFPWTHAAVVATLALLGAILAALGPALRASRLRILDAIAYE